MLNEDIQSSGVARRFSQSGKLISSKKVFGNTHVTAISRPVERVGALMARFNHFFFIPSS